MRRRPKRREGPGGRDRYRPGGTAVGMGTTIGSVSLSSPVCLASGTAGHGAELAPYLDLSALGAVTVKSLSALPWPGNPPPRLRPAGVGMLNSVGLQGPGVERWLEEDLPPLIATGAKVVASIWGRTVEDFARAAAALAGAPGGVVAVEVNVSCPNVEDRRRMFSHSASATAQAVEASKAAGRPLWAKLSPNVGDITEIAGAALEGGAEALVLVNTLLGMAIDVHARSVGLGGGGGGLSGPPVHPVAVRAVWDCAEAFPDAAIVGVGGVFTGEDAAELILAGARAIQVGTATFADPGAAARIAAELEAWCAASGASEIQQMVGAAHGR